MQYVKAFVYILNAIVKDTKIHKKKMLKEKFKFKFQTKNKTRLCEQFF
jgi:hypothetical protein